MSAATANLNGSRTFRVLEWKLFAKNTLCGFFSIEMPSGLILHDCTMHEKNGSRWIGLPAKPFEKADRSKSWTPVVEFSSKESRDKFQQGALDALDAYFAGAAR